jgi:hypothetical protein
MTLCVFHVERTPSLRIWPDGSYYCHGCSARGDARDHWQLRGIYEREVVTKDREQEGQLRLPGVG